MKNQKSLFLTYLVAAVVSILGTLSATLICQSEFFVNTKYSFALMVLTLSAFVICFVFRAEYKFLNESHQKNINHYRDEADKYKERVLELSEENAVLNDQLGYYTDGAFQEVHNELKEKCNTIEAFRNSFPYRIADGYVLYNAIRTEIFAGSHSVWLLIGQYGEELWSYTVVRPAAQSYKEMLTLVGTTTAPDELSQLDQCKSIMWK